MRKSIILLLSIILIAACGDKNTTEPTPPTGVSIVVNPERVILDIGQSYNFVAFVYGATNRNVTWLVQDMQGGDNQYGTINQDGRYHAPLTEPAIDSVKVTAVAEADTSKRDNGWVIIIDPDRIYVSESGSDTTGIGSKQNPYRTLTKATIMAQTGQTIIVRPGIYDQPAGEVFPVEVPSGVTLTGAGSDSSFVVGPGGGRDQQASVFLLDGDAITVEKISISTADDNGIGIWLLPGILVKIRDNNIGPNYIGISASGVNLPRPLIESNIISGDSIGIATNDACEPILRNNQIFDCGIVGVRILGSSRPDLGTRDTTDAGGNTIQDCGTNNQWLIWNGSPDSIWAVGNSWPFPNPTDNDQFIYDDEESFYESGPVMLINP